MNKIKIGEITILLLMGYYFVFGIMDYLMIPSRYLNQLFDFLALFVCLCILLKRGKIYFDEIMIGYLFLFAVFFGSYLVNSPPLIDAIKQMRQYFICAVFYLILRTGNFTREYFDRLMYLLFKIAYVQAPAVIVQKVIYPYIPLRFKGGIGWVDYASGTLGFMASGTTACFLVLMLIIKLQEGFEKGFSLKRILQMLMLLIPLPLLESDAQIFFLPIILLALMIINRKISLRMIKYFALSIAVIYVFNAVLTFTTGGRRSAIGYVKMHLNKEFYGERMDYEYLVRHKISLNRLETMRYFIKGKIKKWGDGPGVWSHKDRMLNPNPLITMGSTIILNYAELGIYGIMVVMVIPIYPYLKTKKDYWGKIVKIQSLYVFMLLFYHMPLYKVSIATAYFLPWLYYRKFIGGAVKKA